MDSNSSSIKIAYPILDTNKYKRLPFNKNNNKINQSKKKRKLNNLNKPPNNPNKPPNNPNKTLNNPNKTNLSKLINKLIPIDNNNNNLPNNQVE